jgi:hypothetical protein
MQLNGSKWGQADVPSVNRRVTCEAGMPRPRRAPGIDGASAFRELVETSAVGQQWIGLRIAFGATVDPAPPPISSGWTTKARSSTRIGAPADDVCRKRLRSS